ncbi:MAG: hypothetical protein ACRDI3_00355 [Actinomycetota bacterium]
MIPCPHLDYSTDDGDPVQKQVAELLTHYDEEHGDGLPEDAREVIRACARALGGTRVK